MTRGARKSGGRRLRRLREVDTFQRTSRQHPEKTTILIVGEGQETEPNYFRGLIREEAVSAKFAVTVKKGPGYSAEAVVKEAIKYKKSALDRHQEYDEVWCVLDVEGLSKRDSLDRAVALAESNAIKLCLSNPCFEIWLMSHFAREARSHNDCDAVIVALNRHWQRHYAQDYRKNDDRIYQRVSTLTREAIENAKWVRETGHADKENTADANSSTEVYCLVGRLLGPPEA